MASFTHVAGGACKTTVGWVGCVMTMAGNSAQGSTTGQLDTTRDTGKGAREDTWEEAPAKT